MVAGLLGSMSEFPTETPTFTGRLNLILQAEAQRAEDLTFKAGICTYAADRDLKQRKLLHDKERPSLQTL